MERRVGGEAVPGQPLGEDADPVGETGPVPQQHPVGVRLVRHVPLRRCPGAGPTEGEGMGETEVAGVFTKYYRQEQKRECVILKILVDKSFKKTSQYTTRHNPATGLPLTLHLPLPGPFSNPRGEGGRAGPQAAGGRLPSRWLGLVP